MRNSSFDAIIFDLDGVITDTASVHAAAWKVLFDRYLRARSVERGHRFVPFSLEEDYRACLDGKPRYDGVHSFLCSRGISLTYGHSSDRPDRETVCGLGNLKDQIFADLLSQNGVDVFDGSVRFIRELKSIGVRLGVASSSKNCRRVLEIADLDGLFDARVDGVVSADLGLQGKPSPDIFLRCSELLGVTPARSVVVEDAIVGVQAGRRGGFRLVIGVDHTGAGEALKDNGADIVVSDLMNVSPLDVDRWCRDTRRAPTRRDGVQ